MTRRALVVAALLALGWIAAATVRAAGGRAGWMESM